MKIKDVEIRNIKSIRKLEISFSDGITVISGENGSGKSTLFEAVGFALFGLNPKDFIGKNSDFLTFGERFGGVKVIFEGVDEKNYFVERKVGETAKLLSLIDDTPMELSFDISIDEKIKEILGLDKSKNLKEQFIYIIGPLQSSFLYPFDVPGKPRINEFDKILGISQWRDAFEHTQSLGSIIGGKIDSQRGKMELLQEDVENYDVKVEEKEKKTSDLKKKKEELERMNAKFKKTETEEKVYEEIRKKIEKGEKKLLGLQGDLRSQENLKSTKEKDRENAQRAKEIVQQTFNGKIQYEEAEKELKILRQRDEEKREIEELINRLKTAIGRLEAEISEKNKSIRKQEKELKEARDKFIQEKYKNTEFLIKEKESIKPIEEEVQKIEAQIERLKATDLGFIQVIKSKIQTEKARIHQINEDILEIEKALQKRGELLKRSNLGKKVKEELDSIESMKAKMGADIKVLQEGKAHLMEGIWPYFGDECKNLEGKDPEKFFDERILSLKQEIGKIEKVIGEKRDFLKEVEKASQNLLRLSEQEKQKKKLEEELVAIKKKLTTSVDTRMIEETINQIEGVNDILKIKYNTAPLSNVSQNFKRALIELNLKLLENSKIPLKTSLKVMSSQADEMMKNGRDSLSKKKKGLETIQKEIERITRELDNLDKKEEVLKEEKQNLQSFRVKKQEKGTERNSLQEKAVSFGDLQKEIKEQEGIKIENEEAHKQYTAHIKEAERLISFQRELLKITRNISELQKSIGETNTSLASLKKKYDENLHQKKKEEVMVLRENITGARKDIETFSNEIKRLGREIEKMNKKKSHIEELKSDISDLDETNSFISFMRNSILNRVSERVSDILQEDISTTANKIYRVVSKKDEELIWDQGYTINLIDYYGGKIRKRKDRQLSGGEFVNAVIALRLALLQAIGARIAIFDEPTSNLDEDRRENLVMAFKNIEEEQRESPWYDQLFLVSHDIRFAEITDWRYEFKKDKKKGTFLVS